jgi:hypothetical protein
MRNLRVFVVLANEVPAGATVGLVEPGGPEAQDRAFHHEHHYCGSPGLGFSVSAAGPDPADRMPDQDIYRCH